jgi:uracil-DNA glycosylase
MNPIGTFASGQPILDVVQTDRTPKHVFVLGVYASAVHARWIDQDGKTRIMALAVASEPTIFWTGEGAEDIIAKIKPPGNIGHLESAGANLNGPSGHALDEKILGPLGVSRDNAWLCDLVPHSCMNHRQEKALRRENLPIPNWPHVPKCLANKTRRAVILDELQTSEARVLVTLGDQPLQWFAAHFGAKPQLADYGEDAETYGQLHPIQVPGRTTQLLPLAHPRQIARLGAHSDKWATLHEIWVDRTAPRLLRPSHDPMTREPPLNNKA